MKRIFIIIAVIALMGGSLSAQTVPGNNNQNSVNAVDKQYSVNGISFLMVYVKGGTFQMGSDAGDKDEKPVHSVALSDYYIGETEVTQELWSAVMGAEDIPSYWKGDRMPVDMVDWSSCNEFIEKLNHFLAGQLPAGYEFSLPSEAQWEYAARGGNKSMSYAFSGSNDLSEVAWFDMTSEGQTHEVKRSAPNELFLYDMSGNVWEWCKDSYSATFYSANKNWSNPVNEMPGLRHVLRGGSWFRNAKSCTVSYRYYYSSGTCPASYGFRLALVRK